MAKFQMFGDRAIMGFQRQFFVRTYLIDKMGHYTARIAACIGI
jgi:hypothetical protein